MSETTVAGLRQALPYLRLFSGQTFVVKCGGEAISRREDALRLLEQISILHQLGIHVILVHGGGVQASELAKRLGAESRFIDGRRVTDAGMLEAMILALNGEARTMLLAACRELKLPAIGLSGIDAGLVLASKRPTTGKADFGFVGDLESVNPSALFDLLQAGYLPIVSPLGADAEGQVLNINADVVASAIAVSLSAAKLILVTGVRGILRSLDDPGSLVSHLTLSELEKLESDGTFDGGMLPKATCIRSALSGGVSRVHVISYDFPDSILTEIFTNEGCGTLIVEHEEALLEGNAFHD